MEPQIIKVVVPAEPVVVRILQPAEPTVLRITAPGPQGPPGLKGEPGVVGGEPDVPDLSLLFENQLV